MQIDGHHALTYIAARLAGYLHEPASLIAHSAQYVDDATNSGIIAFDNGAMYHRFASAHKMLDYRNASELANHQVWIPFHFLPGNGGEPAGSDPQGSFIRKLVCYPNSYVARDMLRACAQDMDKPYALHRLGITMHVYADTFAHQGFAGVNHKINEVHNLESNDSALDKYFFDKIESYFVSAAFPLGHGAALSHPDRPALKWSYDNGLGEPVKRDNTEIFLRATEQMCKAMRCFRTQQYDMALEDVPGLPEQDKAIIGELLQSIKGDSGEQRHAQWLAEISKGRFSFGGENIQYIAKGVGSWKHQAIGQTKNYDDDDEVFPYNSTFLSSHWKLFHDALQAHRLDVLIDILPKYGICAA